MNCNDFEVIAGDLSKESLMDAKLREKGLEHSASCADCAVRLDDERVLTEGLRFLVQSSTEEAPPSIEAAVLTAFREHQINTQVPVTIRTTNRWWVYAASAAAMALIATLIVLNASRTQNQQGSSPQGVSAEAIPYTPSTPNLLPRPLQMPATVPQIVDAKTRSHRGQRRSIIRQKSLPEETNSNAITEITTDFIPLTNREALAQMDGGQVMRVELPRSALMSFGLPMDMERATERIKADVVVGNDGLARAIRFVR